MQKNAHGLYGIRMRSALILLGLVALSAAGGDKQRNWRDGKLIQSGNQQVVRAWGSILNQRTAIVNEHVNIINSEDKEYLATGYIGTYRHPADVGETIRFAVDGQRMYVLFGGKEYRLYIQESRVRETPK